MSVGTLSIVKKIRNAAVLLAALTVIATPLFAQSTDALSQLQQVQNALQSSSSNSGDSRPDDTRSSNLILQPANAQKNPGVTLPPSRLEQIMSSRAGAAL